ncbi:MAG: AAA family ATPase [Chloroflexi bacterium]|nr:AAA family ATPase [Chloroflexota bacterium]
MLMMRRETNDVYRKNYSSKHQSYGSTPTTIEFKEGINLITGANGAGKSTILEAIGFVLFDALPYSQSDFERRGKSGTTKITIRLHSAYDNRVYDIERAIPARYKVINVQDNIDEGIQSKEDLLGWLCQHLKLEGQEDLKPLFENTVGVQQGTITAIFLESARGRKATFDSLLRVQDFEGAWNELGETRKHILDLINNNANDIARKEGQIEHLRDLEISVQATHTDIAAKQDEFEELVAKLQTLKIALEQLDQQKQQLDILNRQIEQANKDIQHLQKNLITAQDDFNNSQAAHEIVIENEEFRRLHSEAVECLKGLEEQRKQRDELIENKRIIEKKIDTTKLQIEQIEKDLAEVETAEVQVIQLEPLIQKQEHLEHEQTQSLEKQKERARLLDQGTIDEQKRESLESDLQELREKVGERKQLAEQVEQLRQQEDRLTIQINELSARRSPLEKIFESARQIFW